MDYIFAAVSRLQSAGDISVNEVVNILQDQKKANRFMNYFRNSQQRNNGKKAYPFPASYEDTLSYIMFLAKGLYFLQKGTVLNERRKIVVPFLACRGFLDEFGDIYKNSYDSNCFADLRKNPLSKVLGDGEATTWSRGKEHVVTLNDTILIHVYVLNRNRVNKRRRLDALKRNFHHLRES